MTIETKFNVGDAVYCLHGGKIVRCKIEQITIKAYSDQCEDILCIEYDIAKRNANGYLSMQNTVEDSEIFHSVEDLTAMLLNNINE